MSDVVAVLREARARIQRGWCQGWNARASDWNGVAAESEHACAWCAYGALIAVTPRGPRNSGDSRDIAWGHLQKALEPHSGRLGYTDVVSYNDTPGRTKEDILALYDRAIALAEGAI